MVITRAIITSTRQVNTVERVSNVAQRLKEYRDDYGLTLSELSEKCKIPAQTLNRYELGQRKPKIDTAVKIAEALNVSPLWLQGYAVPMDPYTLEMLENESKTIENAPKGVVAGYTVDGPEVLARYSCPDDTFQGKLRQALITLDAIVDYKSYKRVETVYHTLSIIEGLNDEGDSQFNVLMNMFAGQKQFFDPKSQYWNDFFSPVALAYADFDDGAPENYDDEFQKLSPKEQEEILRYGVELQSKYNDETAASPKPSKDEKQN